MRSIINISNPKWFITGLLLLVICSSTFAQFYTGMRHPFGKNRIQHEDFYWTSYKFPKFTIYQNSGGTNLSEYTARHAQKIITEVEQMIGYSSRQKINFIIYNKQNEFEQSNIGLDGLGNHLCATQT
ncbi:MAG: hypothetical protein ACPGEG_09995, partial [Salibacteraceae bacterium]